MEAISLEALASFGVGHAHDEAAGTGCTVVVAPHGATCGVDVRGGGPATRETDLLKPENMVESVHAVVLSGGSAFGLEASCGVMDVLSEEGVGFRLGGACIPIVTGACLFDVLVGKNAHPDKAMGGEGRPFGPRVVCRRERRLQGFPRAGKRGRRMRRDRGKNGPARAGYEIGVRL